MISGSTTQLKVLVPPKCGTGPVTVMLDDELYSEDGPVFTYIFETKVSVFAGSANGTSGDTGNGTAFLTSRFKNPTQVAVDASNNVYVLDEANRKIKKLDVTSGLCTILSDSNSQVTRPFAIAIDENNILYASTFTYPKSIVYRYTPGSSFPTIYFSDFDFGKRHVSLAPEGNGKFYIGRMSSTLPSLPDVSHFSPAGNQPFIDNAGNVICYKNGFVYQINSVVDKLIHQTEFSKYNVKDTVETMLIDKTGGLNLSLGLVLDDAGNAYIADTQNNRILKYSTAGVVTTLVATGLNKPQGLAMDKSGNIYVADTGNHCIKKINFD